MLENHSSDSDKREKKYSSAMLENQSSDSDKREKKYSSAMLVNQSSDSDKGSGDVFFLSFFAI